MFSLLSVVFVNIISHKIAAPLSPIELSFQAFTDELVVFGLICGLSLLLKSNSVSVVFDFKALHNAVTPSSTMPLPPVNRVVMSRF